MKAVGILGGTFNPIHNGHLLLAEQARESFSLQEVWFVPNPAPPHRARGPHDLADPERRYEMVARAVADHPAFVVSREELDHPGVAYTVDTVERLKARHPGCRFSFVTGADSLLVNPWKDLDRLLGMLERFLAARRPGFSWLRLERKLQALGLKHLDRVVRLDMPAFDVSSSRIRERVAAGGSVRYLIPESVRRYILTHGLYGAATQQESSPVGA